MVKNSRWPERSSRPLPVWFPARWIWTSYWSGSRWRHTYRLHYSGPAQSFSASRSICVPVVAAQLAAFPSDNTPSFGLMAYLAEGSTGHWGVMEWWNVERCGLIPKIICDFTELPFPAEVLKVQPATRKTRGRCYTPFLSVLPANFSDLKHGLITPVLQIILYWSDVRWSVVSPVKDQ